jgi:predicted DNA-binding transcriptional regulator AlpA
MSKQIERIQFKTFKTAPVKAPPAFSNLELISKAQLAALIGVNTWTIDRWRRIDPDFPAPIWISPSTPRWRRVDIETWIAQRPRGSVAPAWQHRRRKGKADA